MGSWCSTLNCCSDDEERAPFANIGDPPDPQGHGRLARQPLPDHELKNRRVRMVIGDEFRGGLVKEVFAIVQDEFHEEAQLLLDDDLNLMFVSVNKLEAVDDIKLGDYCVVRTKPEQNFQTLRSGFARFIHPESSVTKTRFISLHLRETNYNHEILRIDFKDCHLIRAPPPVTEEVSDPAPPISSSQLKHFHGRNKGIQGKRNSCYLDTLLFSLFAFSDVVLTAIKETENVDEMNFRILCHSIIFPLRVSHFVSKDHVEFLRSHMSKLTGNESFEGEARDLPETIEALFGKMLSWKPQLSISSIETTDYHFDPSFMLQLMDTEVDVPRTQSLLYAAACNQKFCIQKVPSLFILQLPRETLHYQMIFPDLEIDLGPTLFDSPKFCSICGQAANLQFLERFEAGGLPATFLCRGCAETLELSLETGRELPEARQDGDSRMILSAVICIERSHYNCFARCGPGHKDDRWVFFDSMSDQEELMDPPTRRDILFNIPLVELVPHFVNWLSDAPERWLVEDRSLDGFLQELDEKARDRATRLLKYAYMLFYTKPDEEP